MTEIKDRSAVLFPGFIILLALLNFIRSTLLNDIIWDDNCWILSHYFTNSLDEFLGTGFYELRRVPLGTFTYYYFSLHKFSDHAYLIWNSINLVVQVLSPLLLYFFIQNLFKKRLLALVIAASFTVCLLDNTLPYYTSITYRLGTLLCIISFYLTERALLRQVRWGLISIALLLSAFSSYVLMETTVALEPARLFLIGYLLSEKKVSPRNIIKRSLALWLPFILIIVPLLIYKLIYKPYGIYEAAYPFDPLFFMNFKLHAKVIRQFMFYNWFLLIKLLAKTSVWSVVLGAMAAGASFVLITKVPDPDEADYLSGSHGHSNFKMTVLENLKGLKYALTFGLILIVPAISMYEFAGRVPAPGMEGRHATILLFGFSILLGSLLYCLYTAARSINKKSVLAPVLIVLFLGAGTFFNNMNLDVYFTAQSYQRDFWKTFTNRFPALPEKATFLFDVKGEDSYYYFADLEAYYELELPLNMLYARSKDPDKFLNYRIYTISEGIKDEWKRHGNVRFERLSHAGMDVFNSRKLIIVRHRMGGDILVNREILDKHPDVPYRMWLDKDPPAISGDQPEYPLRHKFMGF